MRSHPTRKNEPDLFADLAQIAAEVHTDTQSRERSGDKKSARRHGVHPSSVWRWRNHGVGSPVYGVLAYIEGLDAHEAMRVAGQVLAAARAKALGGKSVDELVAIYQTARANEIDREAEDRRVEMPGHPWLVRSRASLRDGSTEILCGSIEYLLDRRGVDETRVFPVGAK